MKKVFRYIIAGLLSLSFASCLDLDPKDQLSDPNLWSKPGDFENFANLYYEWLPNFTQVYDGNIHADKRSDLLMDKNGKNIYSNGTNSVGASDGDYGNSYKHIYRCCLLLQNAEKYGNKSEIAQSIGEAYFFRAWTYFFLVQKFGDVILVDEPIDVDDPRMNATRNDRGEVIDFVIQDLKNAAGYLKPTADLPEGRIGREGALAFMSRVALFEGTWQKCRDNVARGRELCDIAAKAAKEVIDGGKFELFAPAALGDSAQKYMFILENTKCNPAGLQKNSNKEYIIKVCFDETLKPTGQNLTTEVLANAQYVTAKLADMYLCSDGLPIEKSKVFQGYDKMRSEWMNRDNRMRYTLMRPGDSFWNNSGNNCRIDWSGSEEELTRAKYTNFQPWGSGYFPQKWATERECTDRNESYDFPVLRYAEVLLNYAEAVYERDDAISDNDLDISLNLTRCRVNKSMPKLSNSLVSANGLNMREEIRRERTIELFQEGFRIDDLKRWHTAHIEMPQDLLGIKWVGEWKTKWAKPGYAVNSDDRLVLETGRVFQEKHYLYPLPVDQQQLNPNIGQNPGWPKFGE